MNTSVNTTPSAAADLAANFQVTELEPRLENLWAGGEKENAEPACITAGTCSL